jgi:hypothetical protein
MQRDEQCRQALPLLLDSVGRAEILLSASSYKPRRYWLAAQRRVCATL